jgi:hypothetical protein
MATYVQVPADAIESELQARGFTRSVQREEVVYSRCHEKNPDVVIKVYTSIRVGRSAVRACGKDSIKACTVFDNGRKSFGIGKFSPIFRVGSVEAVLERMLERARQAYARGSEWIRQNDEQMASRQMALRLQEKAEYAVVEAEQERQGFMSDPDMRQFRSMRRGGVVQGGIDP